MSDTSAFAELTHSIAPDHLVRICLRLLIALIIGGLVGIQRELTHKPAGLRTHMLLALGTALFVILAEEGGNEQKRPLTDTAGTGHRHRLPRWRRHLGNFPLPSTRFTA